MSRFFLKFTASALALALSLAPAWTSAAAQASPPTPPVQSYVVIDLTPAGSATSSAAGVSGARQVGSAGFAPAAGQPVVNHAVLWNGSASGAVDLGPGTAAALSDGQQVGSANDHAALWLGTAASRIDLNPSQWLQSVATGVAGGQQVGWATRSVPCTTRKGSCSNGTRTEFHPFLWSGSAASAVDLTPLVLGYGAGRAFGTDGTQQVGVGFELIGTNAFRGPFAVLWSGTAESAVNLNPFDAATSQANAVAGGQQVGYGYTPKRALLWRGNAESMVDMHPEGYTSSEANATNGFQQVGYGYVYDPVMVVSHSHALVWSGDAASAVDLNQYLPDGFTDAAATGIDADGRIVGWAGRGSSDPADVHAVMWVPVVSGEAFASTVSLDRPGIAVGEAVRVTVKLSRPAPQGGASVNLSHAFLSPTAGAAAAPPLTVEMPPVVTVPEGESAASFDVVTAVTTLDGFTRPYLIDIRATYGGTTPNATLTVEPPLFVSTLSVAPGSVAGGANATATVTLNGVAPAGGALVALASDSPAAVVPSSVLVPAGQTGVTFGVKTNAVTTSTTATLAATYGSSLPATRTAQLIVNPAPAQAADRVAIQTAEYRSSKRQLSVQATSSNASATLTVSVAATGQVIGVLGNRGGGRYEATFSVATNPQTIVVRSSLGGSASRAVTLK